MMQKFLCETSVEIDIMLCYFTIGSWKFIFNNV